MASDVVIGGAACFGICGATCLAICGAEGLAHALTGILDHMAWGCCGDVEVLFVGLGGPVKMTFFQCSTSHIVRNSKQDRSAQAIRRTYFRAAYRKSLLSEVVSPLGCPCMGAWVD